MTLHVDGGSYALAVDLGWNGEGIYQWEGPIPSCPDCGEPLTEDGAAHARASVLAVDIGTYDVLCDACQWTGRLQ